MIPGPAGGIDPASHSETFVGVASTPSPPTPDSATSGPRPRLSVVIVNYNSWPDVARLVASLARAPEVTAGLCRLAVVDNASAAPPPPELRTPGVRLVRRRDNGGFAAGVNAGWHASDSP